MGIQTHVDDLEPVAWALMSLAIILAVVRLIVRYLATRNLGLEDIMIGVATLMDIGGTISLSLAVTNGLGRHAMTLTPQQNTERSKDNYAQHLLYIATIATAKLSMTVFFNRLAVQKIHLRCIWALAGIITAWAVSSLFIIAFQCPMPEPWNPTFAPPGSCLTQDIWIYIVGIDCLTEAFIMALPIWIVWRVQIPFNKKLLIQFLFSIRVIVIAASVTRYVASQARPTKGGFDTAYDQSGYWLWTSLQCTLAIIAACTPALKPFLEYSASRIGDLTGFQRSTGDSGHKYFNGSGSGSGNNTFRLKSFGGGLSGSGGSRVAIGGGSSGANGGLSNGGRRHHSAVVFSDAVKVGGGTGMAGDSGAGLGHQTRIQGIERTGSSSDSVDTEASGAMIIRQTTEWDIDYDGGDRDGRTDASSRSRTSEAASPRLGMGEDEARRVVGNHVV
ncbi:hypothetical protein K490DRAFT_54315 [Saccharata proteae CBS 121410]|uniref:Rhodopsin domain-containing protein n=1 Tax=Saccharata proteae CBS 121410 TaxID=1314787 RepID=A0A9P4HZB3_9PEZI|nr:hypothetical protein K490DRAFT_54315 [Saccharata proteae CBS 121410]